MAYTQRLLYADNAATTLGTAINTTVTTITLATGQGALFPNPSAGQAFLGTLFAQGSTTGLPCEIVLVTARVGDTLTVVRAQEGTTAQSWAVGDNFANFNTSGTMQQFAQLPDVQTQAGNSAVDSGSANAGVITLSPAPAALASLLYAPIRVLKGGAANTAGYTLNINGFGALPVLYQGSSLLAGDLGANLLFEVFYDGTNLELLSPPGVPRTGSPSGPAGGDLTGFYPNPTVTANAITTAKMAQAAANAGLLGNITGATANPAYTNKAGILAWLGSLGVPVAAFANQQASGAGSGESLPNSTYTTRALNTTLINNISGASLSGSDVILPPGTYFVAGMGSSQATSNTTNYTHMMRLHDNTLGSTLLSGLSNGYAGSSNEPIVEGFVLGGFTITGTDTLQFDSWVSWNCNGGNPINSGEDNIFAVIAFLKVA